MQTQHTPGPWNDGLHYHGNLAVQADNGRLVALCGRLSLDDEQLENQANARLIAAAPDLLSTLLWLLEDLSLHAPKLGPLRSIAAAQALRESLEDTQ